MYERERAQERESQTESKREKERRACYVKVCLNCVSELCVRVRKD